MAFGSIALLLLFYYIRPQDWVPGMSGFNIIKLVVAGGIIGLTKRERGEPRWPFMGTPQEWALMIFFGFAVFTSSEFMATLTDLGTLVVFTFIVLHTLTTPELLERYLRWWLIALICVLVIITLTRMGLDVTNATANIDMMRGRFCLGTYTMNNPNAVGHTMVAVLPLGYYMWFWARDMANRLRACVLFVVGVWAVIPTESKGAFISGSVSFLVSVLFGRKVLVQIVVGLAALGMGGTILATLPRMEGMKNLGGDEGVQGRMMAWSMARAVTMTQMTGMGYKQFVAMIRWEGSLIEKATHSSFVKVGGDLGSIGLTLYVGLFIISGRTLIQYAGLNETMERCRRSLFSLLLGLVVSGWMLDRAYYTELFCLIGAIGAYHQLSVKQRREAAMLALEQEAEQREKMGKETETPHGLAPAFARAAPGLAFSKAASDSEEEFDGTAAAGVRSMPAVPGLWTHLGLLDVVMVVVGGQLTMQFWDYIMSSIR